MRNFTTSIFIGTILLATTVISCKEQKESKNSEETTVEQKASTPAAAETATPSESVAVLNANLATKEDLIGIGLSTEVIDRIIEQRPFLHMNDFDKLLGTAVDKSELYQKIFIPFNLNTTAEADFKMIPGVGDRMAHEFEEYRPYINLAQFRREIGKYVDEDEVARYEHYVFVPIELNTASEEVIMALPGVGKRMAHEFEEYRPYTSMEQFRKEIGKYVDDKELARLERLVYLQD